MQEQLKQNKRQFGPGKRGGGEKILKIIPHFILFDIKGGLIFSEASVIIQSLLYYIVEILKVSVS